ncbi:cation:proton antiporter [soil metagenome]
MGHGEGFGHFQDLFLFLATAGVGVPLFKRLKLSPTLGYLLAGLILGPSGLGALTPWAPWLSNLTVNDPKEIAQLAELGVVFLLFTLGLERSLERLRAMAKLVFVLGGLQVILCAGLLAGAVMLAGRGFGEALIVGAALALSSTALVIPAMAERDRNDTPSGRAALGVLLFQDIAIAPILVAVSIFGRPGGVGSGLQAGLAFAPAVIGIVVLVVGGRLILRPIMRSVARAHSDELFLAASLLVVIGAGLVAAVAGLSMALGAFVAGLLLAETEYRHEIETKVEPFKGLLLGLFFLSVGVGLDLRYVAQHLEWTLGLLAVLLAVKGVAVFGLGRAFGLKTRAAAETALLLASGGEFAFVLLGQAGAAKLVQADLAQTGMAAATLSMALTPLLAALGARLNPEVESPLGDTAPSMAEAGVDARVLVVGLGRVGRLVTRMLDRHDIAWTAVERDPRGVERALRAGGKAFIGDAANPDMLRRCGLMTAPALVVTMADPDGAETVVASARDARPDMVIVARARDARHAGRLYALGVTDAVPETIEASLQLSEAVLVDIGVPMGLVIASIHEQRDEIRKALDQPGALGARRRFRSRLAAAPPASS